MIFSQKTGGERNAQQLPDLFTKVELFWTQQGKSKNAASARALGHHTRIHDKEVAAYEPFFYVRRLAKSVNVQDLSGVPIMSSIVCDRLRVVAKYRSYIFRLSRSAQNSQNQRRRVKQVGWYLP